MWASILMACCSGSTFSALCVSVIPMLFCTEEFTAIPLFLLVWRAVAFSRCLSERQCGANRLSSFSFGLAQKKQKPKDNLPMPAGRPEWLRPFTNGSLVFFFVFVNLLRRFVRQRHPKCSPRSFIAGRLGFSGCLSTWMSGGCLPALHPSLCSRNLRTGQSRISCMTGMAEVLRGSLHKCGIEGLLHEWQWPICDC